MTGSCTIEGSLSMVSARNRAFPFLLTLLAAALAAAHAAALPASLHADESSVFRKIGETETGSGPKSLMFSKDGKTVIAALLFDNGVERFSVEPLGLIQRTILDNTTTGFVELAYNEAAGEIWVSQMLTNSIHVLDADTLEPLRIIDTGGVWPKVIAFSPDGGRAYASHWKSLDVSFIESGTGEILGVVPIPGIPRGLAPGPDGNKLYVANFSSGSVDIVSVGERRVTERIEEGGVAMRHLVVASDGMTAYGSDMYRGRIAKIDLESRSIVWSDRLASNPNTIVLSPDDRFLFVSCRGKNNEVNWHEKGGEHGKIFVLDSSTLDVIDWIWGGNQPTGLAVSQDGTLLVFSNFYDNTIELYEIDL